MLKNPFPFVVVLLGLAVTPARTADRAFTGVITDTMCGASHAMMGKTPAPECTVQCVKSNPKEIKYALAVGKNVYVLSDQQTSEKFSGLRVLVTGTLDAKNKTIEVKKIVAASRPASGKRARSSG